MQLPIDRIEEIVRGMFDGREAVTRDEVMRAVSDAGISAEGQAFLVLLPPGAYTRDELLGEIRARAAAYSEAVPTRTSDRD